VIVPLFSLLVLKSLSVNPKWELAIVRNEDIWLSRADGTQMRRLIQHADTPRWNPDGTKLAYAKGLDIWIHDFKRRTDRRVARFPKLDRNDNGKYLEWDPKLPILLTATASTQTVRLVGLGVPTREDEILAGTVHGPTNTMRWSPSGLTMAYVHSGDIWIAKRDVQNIKVELDYAKDSQFDGWSYYDYAQRLAALASFNDAENGASATTPFWVSELAWTGSGKRLAFGYSRIWGSGVEEIGYLDLVKVPEDWPNYLSGYQVKTHWIWKETYQPKICPDGQTLSFIKLHWSQKDDRDWLSVGTWDGKSKRKLIPDVEEYDWRPHKLTPKHAG
jgi:Tol biopolymer transport system component